MCFVFGRDSANVRGTVCSAQRVGFFNIGSGRVLEKIPGSGSGSGRVGVLKNTIGYFRVSFLLSGNSGYSGYFRVIPGNSQIICKSRSLNFG